MNMLDGNSYLNNLFVASQNKVAAPYGQVT